MTKQQEGKTYGNAGLFKALVWSLRHFGIRPFYIIAYVFFVPVAVCFSRGAGYTFSYYHDRLRWSRWRSIKALYRNHSIFGETVVDKFAMYAGHQFRIKYHGLKEYDEVTQKPEAMIQLSAHIGCSEILGYSYNNNKPCNVLVFGGEKEVVMRYRQSAFGNKDIKMIPVATEGSHSDDIIRALDNGEIVSVFADRFVNDKKLIISTIHGYKVKLARGPFSMAVNRGLTVFMASAMKERDGSYTAYFTPLYYDRTAAPKQQRQQLADAYCAEIERLMEIYPLQWFNYSDLWLEAVSNS